MQQPHLLLRPVPQGESLASQTEEGDTNLLLVCRHRRLREVVGGENHIGCHRHDTRHFCGRMGKMQPTTSMLATAASSLLIDMHTIHQRLIRASDIFQPRLWNPMRNAQ